MCRSRYNRVRQARVSATRGTTNKQQKGQTHNNKTNISNLLPTNKLESIKYNMFYLHFTRQLELCHSDQLRTLPRGVLKQALQVFAAYIDLTQCYHLQEENRDEGVRSIHPGASPHSIRLHKSHRSIKVQPRLLSPAPSGSTPPPKACVLHRIQGHNQACRHLQLLSLYNSGVIWQRVRNQIHVFGRPDNPLLNRLQFWNQPLIYEGLCLTTLHRSMSGTLPMDRAMTPQIL